MPTFSDLPAELRLMVYRFALGLREGRHADLEVVPKEALKFYDRWKRMYKQWSNRTNTFRDSVFDRCAPLEYWSLIPKDVRLGDFPTLSLIDRRANTEVTGLLYDSITFHICIGNSWSRQAVTLPVDGSGVVKSIHALFPAPGSRIASLHLVIRGHLSDVDFRADTARDLDALVDGLVSSGHSLKRLVVQFNAMERKYNLPKVRRYGYEDVDLPNQQHYQYMLEPLVKLAPIKEVEIRSPVDQEFSAKLASVMMGTQNGILREILYREQKFKVPCYKRGYGSKTVKRSGKWFSKPAYDWSSITVPEEEAKG